MNEKLSKRFKMILAEEAKMRGRPKKPLEVIRAEGGQVRLDRINISVPVPPAGELAPASDLTPLETAIWNHTLNASAPGLLRPLDSALLRRYCWTLAKWLELIVEHRQWCESGNRGVGETTFLRRARNGELCPHPVFRLSKDLQETIRTCELDLGLSPMAREHIHMELQGKLFPGKSDEAGEYAEFPQTPLPR